MALFSSILIEVLKTGNSLAVLTGAGISAESGVPTFRGEGGLWRTFRPEELATPLAFNQNPRLVWEWYEYRREIVSKASPNPGHLAIAQLEQLFSEFLLITQNVDGLHQRAGSKKMVELHGNIFRFRCSKEGRIFEELPSSLDIPPLCSCGALLRPDVVWFGESLPLDALAKAEEAARRSALFLVVGTSALVQPAASLPLLAKSSGAYVVEINKDSTPLSSLVDESLRGKAGEILPKLVEVLIRVRDLTQNSSV